MSKKARGHSVMVPDILWRKFQWRSGGLTNPGSFIRECLFDWISNEEEQDSLRREYEHASEHHPEQIVAIPDSVEVDRGRVLKLKYRAVCQDCGDLLQAGSEAVVATMKGKRIYRHPEHLVH